jgi:DNA-binding transcriptional LysR family regulator
MHNSSLCLSVAPFEIDLMTLRIVRAIADAATLSGAAAHLGYSQPAVSQHLARASARLGQPLVTRAGRTVRLTEAGAVLARYAVSVQSALDTAAGEIADLGGLRSGSVRVAAFPTASATVVPRLLGAMAARHPGVRLSYVEVEPPEALDLLRSGRADVAITFRYRGDWSDPHARYPDELTMVPLFDDELLVAEPSATKATKTRTTLRQYSDADWIAGCPQCRGNLLQVCQTAGFQPRISHETDNAAAVLGLVANGLGVAQMPRLALSSVTVPDQVRLVSVAGMPDRTVHAVVLRAAQGVPAIAAALQSAADLDVSDWVAKGSRRPAQ